MGSGYDLFDWMEEQNAPVSDEDLKDPRAVMARYADKDGYPIIPTDIWNRLNAMHRQRDVKMAFCQQLADSKAPFPLRPPPLHEAEIAFRQLVLMPWQESVTRPARRYEARVPYAALEDEAALKGVITKRDRYNDCSNHFQWENRMRCGGWNDPSPIEAWSTLKGLYGMRWTFWSMNREGPISVETWRKSFTGSSSGAYTAAQFRPSAAKGIYGWLASPIVSAGRTFRVVDPACGWGDRLAGFYATPGAEFYAGCDPNPETYAAYAKQVAHYEVWSSGQSAEITHFEIGGRPAFRSRGASGKTVVIINAPFEDVPWFDPAVLGDTGVDIVFTSPPYFCTEKYAADTDKSNDQSWSRYSTFASWRDDFFFPMMRTASEMVRPRNGVVALNIADPLIRNKNKEWVRSDVGDPLIEFARKELGMAYDGAGGLALSLRPSSSDRSKLDRHSFIEPIWLFSWTSNGDQVQPPSVLHHDVFGQHEPDNSDDEGFDGDDLEDDV